MRRPGTIHKRLQRRGVRASSHARSFRCSFNHKKKKSKIPKTRAIYLNSHTQKAAIAIVRVGSAMVVPRIVIRASGTKIAISNCHFGPGEDYVEARYLTSPSKTKSLRSLMRSAKYPRESRRTISK